MRCELFKKVRSIYLKMSYDNSRQFKSTGPTNNGPGGFRSPTGPGFSRPPFNPNNNYQR